MLINFVNENLTEEIFCDKPCFDNNDVTNLISRDPIKRRRGFLVENFVKPPVVISIKFICNITITKITVYCEVGRQKSSSIEVYTKQNNSAQKIIVARKDLKENESVVNFVQHGTHSLNSEHNISYETFRLSKFIFNVNEVVLRILRTQGSSLVAIGKIEIWGKPSKYVNQDIVKNVYDVWTGIKTLPSKVAQNVDTIQKPIVKKVFRYCREIKIPEVDIPEEFLDPITCEIFVIPMTLPSGKIVDVSTLKRFHKEEEKFGRPPSDPFTGRIFTESSYPIVASALKARLDKFLLDYSHVPSLKSVPRTVGRVSTSQPSCSFVKYQSQDVSKPQTIKTADQLLESCLHGLPSFLEKPLVEIVQNECLKCKSNSLLFKLKCSHLICRHCLLSSKCEKMNFCTKCNQPIEYKDVERYHIQ